jgi:hypothetical protein
VVRPTTGTKPRTCQKIFSKSLNATRAYYLPFEVYAKSLQAYFSNYEQTAGDWERHHSRMYPILDQYQRDGYGAC